VPSITSPVCLQSREGCAHPPPCVFQETRISRFSSVRANRICRERSKVRLRECYDMASPLKRLHGAPVEISIEMPQMPLSVLL